MNDYECGWCGAPGKMTEGQKQGKRRGSTSCCSRHCAGRYSHLKNQGWTDSMVLELLEMVRNEVR